jgi:hypothetical protein
MASPNDLFTSGQILTAQECNNLPFGLVATPISNTSLNQVITTVTDITGITLTFNTVTNRVYRVSYSFFANSTDASSLNVILADGSNTAIQQCIFNFSAPFVPEGKQLSNFFYFTATTTGSITRKLRAQRQSGAGTITIFSAAATLPFQFAVEDCGSV